MEVLRNRAVLALLAFNALAGVLFVGGALLVSFMRSFGTTPSQLGLILGMGWGASVMGSLTGGHFADKIGPKRAVLVTVFLVSLGLLGKAFSRTWLQAGVCHLLTVATQAALFPGAVTLLGFIVEERVGSALGFLNTVLSLVAIPGAAITGLVVKHWGWSALFVRKFALYLASLALLAVMLPEANGRRERATERGGGWRVALSHPGLLLVCASVFVVTLGGYCYAFYPYFIQERFPADASALALFDSLYNGVWTLSNWPAGMVADKIGRGIIAAMGYGLTGLAWFLFPRSPSLPLTYLVYGLYCLGNSMGFYASVFAMDVSPEELKGRAVGLFNASMYLGSALGDTVGGILWQRWGAIPSFLLASAAYLVGALLLVLGKGQRIKPA
jgi:predicted MFS family arabinose efflux permease